jgi:hypothetical protein
MSSCLFEACFFAVHIIVNETSASLRSYSIPCSGKLLLKSVLLGLDWTEQHMHRQPSHPTAVGSSLGVPISFPDLASKS